MCFFPNFIYIQWNPSLRGRLHLLKKGLFSALKLSRYEIGAENGHLFSFMSTLPYPVAVAQILVQTVS